MLKQFSYCMVPPHLLRCLCVVTSSGQSAKLVNHLHEGKHSSVHIQSNIRGGLTCSCEP